MLGLSLFVMHQKNSTNHIIVKNIKYANWEKVLKITREKAQITNKCSVCSLVYHFLAWEVWGSFLLWSYWMSDLHHLPGICLFLLCLWLVDVFSWSQKLLHIPFWCFWFGFNHYFSLMVYIFYFYPRPDNIFYWSSLALFCPAIGLDSFLTNGYKTYAWHTEKNPHHLPFHI